MKQTLVLFFTIGFLITTVFSQDSILLDVHYKPLKTYNQVTEQTSQTELTYIGSDVFLEKLMARNIENPTKATKESTIETTCKTGKIAKNDHFPIEMTFVKSISSDGKKPIPDGTTLYGQCTTTDAMPKLDSMRSDGMDENFKNTVFQSMKSMFSQISFPKKQFRIGDSCAFETPISMPMAGMTINMTITTTYKLMSVSNGIANFDLSQVYTMTSVTKIEMSATGAGKGNLFYDIPNNYYTQYNVEMNMDMKMKLEELEIALKMKNNSKLTVEIKNN
jgi:hypothetical protein